MSACLLARFEGPSALVAAAKALHARGNRSMEAFTPYPVPGLGEALALPRSRLPVVVLAMAMIGIAVGYAVLWWTNAVDYPLNVGGRPSHAWPAFVPITFETMVLFGGVTAFLAFFAMSGLPRLHHRLLDAGEGVAPSYGFYLLVEGAAPGTEAVLAKLGAQEIKSVGVYA